MKLHSSRFERVLRRSVSQAVNSSPALGREFRAANKYRKHHSIMLLLRPAVSLVLAILVWQVSQNTRHVETALAVINLWALGFVFVQAQRLSSCLYSSTDLPALILLPVTKSTVLNWQLQKFLRGTLWFSLDLFGSYTALALYSRFTAAQWFALVPISVAAWSEVLALAALSVAYLPRASYQLGSVSFIGLLFVLLMAGNVVGRRVVALIDQCAPSLNLLLPTGWPVSLFQALLPEGHWMLLFLLLPLGAAVWTTKSSYQRILAGYQFKEPLRPQAPDLAPGTEAELEPTERMAVDNPTRVGPTAIEEIIQSRHFLTAPSWRDRGWFENFLWQILDARERALAEFVFPNGVNISTPWRKVFRNLAITALATVAAGTLAPLARFSVLAGGLFVTFCQALAQVLATGRAFQLILCSGVNIPFHAGYAIGFRELARLLFKYSLVQLPLLLPFAVASGLLVCQALSLPLTDGALFGLKAGGLLLASRFIFVTFAFSAGTNDTSMLRFRSLVLLLLVAAFCLGFVVIGGASLFVPRQYIAWLLWGLASVVAYGFFRVYGWFYHANRFDLMNLPRR